MDKILVNIKDKSYPIYINNSFDDLYEEFVSNCNSKNVLIITDNNVDNLYSKEVEDIFKHKDININKYVIPAGEDSKSCSIISEVYKKCIECNFSKSDCIIGLGGGVVGDIVGFAASTFMRGVNLVLIPTTLLAQTDSSIGGKNGFNLEGYKNIIGTIYQPNLVYINTCVLNTLPKNEFVFGMAEVIKYGLLFDENFYKYLIDNAYNILPQDNNCMRYLIRRCVELKSQIVELDEADKGLRQLLNFGHTIGHAFESISRYSLSHGQSIAVGMVLESKISLLLKLTNNETHDKILKILDRFNLLNNNIQLNSNDLIKYIMKDKKSNGGFINFVVLEQIGAARIIKLQYTEIKSLLNFLKY